MDTNEYDVIIIGGGAAGLSAALVLSRARRRVVVVDSGAPRNAPAAHMQGFLSRDGMPPSELLATGRSEVTAYGGEIVSATVEQLLAAGDTDVPAFVARLTDGTTLHGAPCPRDDRACATSSPTSPGCATVGPATSCTARTATATRSATSGSVSCGTVPATPAYAQIVRQWSHDVVLLAPPGQPHRRAADRAARPSDRDRRVPGDRGRGRPTTGSPG